MMRLVEEEWWEIGRKLDSEWEKGEYLRNVKKVDTSKIWELVKEVDDVEKNEK